MRLGLEDLFTKEFLDQEVLEHCDIEFRSESRESDTSYGMGWARLVSKKEPSYSFKIVEVGWENRPFAFEQMPKSTIDIRSSKTLKCVGSVDMRQAIRDWIELIERYNADSPLFDFLDEDPITQSYYNEIEPNFEIIDEDAAVKPFPIPVQLKLNTWLDKTIKVLEAQEGIEGEVVQDFKEVKSNLSKSTKREVITKIRKAMAKALKMSLEVGQKLLVDYAAEVTKRALMP